MREHEYSKITTVMKIPADFTTACSSPTIM